MILSAMFCLGVFATIAQVLFMRETLVVFFGSELSIGVILACWLLGIGMGAFAARCLSGRLQSPAAQQRTLATILILLAVVLPAQIYGIRIIRLILHVPAGEYASLAAIFMGSFVIFLPTSFGIGLFFPLACALSKAKSGGDPAAIVSRLYTLESVGSMAGGAALTYLLLPAMTPFGIILLASAFALAGAAFLVTARPARVLLWMAAGFLLVAASVHPGWLGTVERGAVQARWRAFGILQPSVAGGSPAVRLAAETDTVYQNLAVTESAGQYVLYGNGQVMSAFPDPGSYEHSIHFIMAQNPKARRVLLLGGNPVGDIPELLKYRLDRLVYVELDPGIGKLIRTIMPAGLDPAFSDKRMTSVYEDAPRYVQRCGEQFDIVLVNAPEPTTAAANRYYTLEFYRNLRRILASDGFICTAVSSSERLESEAADLGASICRTLRKVFPVVLVTAETRNRFLAGGERADLTFDRAVLAARSKVAGIPARYFRPEWFAAADEIDEEKTREVQRKFASKSVPLNTNLRPVTYFYNLFLWSRFSGSRVESLLESLRSLDYLVIVKWILLVGLAALLAGVLRRGIRGATPSGSGWTRFMLGFIMFTTGLCGMALEIVLIYVFQGLYGYVYTRMGLIVAAFMLGLAIGAPCGRLVAGGGRERAWAGLAGVELVLIGCALAIPKLAELTAAPGMAESSLAGFEILIYAAVAIVGWGVGAEFPMANRLYCDVGGTLGASAAITDAADHAGAAVGALAVGVILVPVLGLAASCVVLAALKLAGLLFLGSAMLTYSHTPGIASPHLPQALLSKPAVFDE